jgi:O-antigen ligase
MGAVKGIFSMIPNSRYSKVIGSSVSKLFYAIATILAFALPASSVNYSSIFYPLAIIAVVTGALWLLSMRTLDPLSKTEGLMLLAWSAYPLAAFLEMQLRSGWHWGWFQEPSRFLLVMPLFLMLRHTGFMESALKWGVWLGAIWAGSWALYQNFYLGIQRVWGGTSGLINAFGDISLILGVMSIALFHKQWRQDKRWLVVALLAFGFGAYGSLASGAKGGWISVPFLVWILAGLLPQPTIKKRVLLVAMAGVGFALVVYFVPFIYQRIEMIVPAIYQYSSTGIIAEGSVGIRLGLWHSAFLTFLDNPLFGTGAGTFHSELLKDIEMGLMNARAGTIAGAHSQFFESLVRFGVFGPLLIFSIFGSFIYHCKQGLVHNPGLATAGILMAVGFIGFGMVEHIWDINNAGVFYALMMAIIAGALSALKPTNES